MIGLHRHRHTGDPTAELATPPTSPPPTRPGPPRRERGQRGQGGNTPAHRGKVRTETPHLLLRQRLGTHPWGEPNVERKRRNRFLRPILADIRGHLTLEGNVHTPPPLAFTIARMPALRTDGRLGQAAITATKSRSFGALMVRSGSETAIFPELCNIFRGLIIPWSWVRIPPPGFLHIFASVRTSSQQLRNFRHLFHIPCQPGSAARASRSPRRLVGKESRFRLMSRWRRRCPRGCAGSTLFLGFRGARERRDLGSFDRPYFVFWSNRGQIIAHFS
jgi:hypothetical protein